jgi:SH3 domain protein
LRRALPLLSLLSLFFVSGSHAADTRYVSDKQYIPLRSGPGNEYRITHRGIPSATRLEVKQITEDGEFAEITTEKGTSGWIRTQYLMKNLPAQNQLRTALARLESLTAENDTLKEKAKALSSERAELSGRLSTTDGDLSSVTEELAALKQISGKAVQLDVDNRHLTLETEELRSEVETLKAENRRLQDSLDSEAFMNGALAVLMGVIIALVVPRLWPKRKNNSGWA